MLAPARGLRKVTVAAVDVSGVRKDRRCLELLVLFLGLVFFGTSFVFGTSFKPGTWCPIITLHRVILAIRRTRVRRVSSGGGLGVSFGVRLYPALALKVFSPIPFLSVQTIHSSWHHPARPLQPRINHPPKTSSPGTWWPAADYPPRNGTLSPRWRIGSGWDVTPVPGGTVMLAETPVSTAGAWLVRDVSVDAVLAGVHAIV